MGGRARALWCVAVAVSAVAVGGVLVAKSWLQPGRLQGPPALTVSLPTVFQCLELCLTRAPCRSLNYNPTTSECELNSQGRSTGFVPASQPDWLYVDRLDVQHLTLAGACSHHTCPEQQVCVPLGCNDAKCIPEGGNATGRFLASASITTPQTTSTASGTSQATTTDPTTSEALSTTQATTRATTQTTTGIFAHVNCGPPPAAPAGMTRTLTGRRYLDYANYTCNAGKLWPDSGHVFCNESSKWQGEPGGCSYTNCYDPNLPASYAGTLNVASNGKLCGMWTNTPLRGLLYRLSIWHRVDGSAAAASNYCRAIDAVRPWCYYANPGLSKYGYCDIPTC